MRKKKLIKEIAPSFNRGVVVTIVSIHRKHPLFKGGYMNHPLKPGTKKAQC